MTTIISPIAALSTGRDLFFQHWKILVKLMGTMFLIQLAFGVAAGIMGEDSATGGILSLVGNLVNTYLGFGFVKAFITLYEGGTVEIKDLAQPVKKVIFYVIGSFLYSLATALGFLFLVIPGFYVATKYCFVPLLLVDTDLGIGEAFSKSSEMTEGRKMDIFIFGVLATIGTILGLLAFIVGAIAVSWMALFGFVVLYHSLQTKAK